MKYLKCQLRKKKRTLRAEFRTATEKRGKIKISFHLKFCLFKKTVKYPIENIALVCVLQIKTNDGEIAVPSEIRLFHKTVQLPIDKYRAELCIVNKNNGREY